MIVAIAVTIGGVFFSQDKTIGESDITEESDTIEKSISVKLAEIIQPRKLDTEDKVLEFIKNYQGTDDEGDTLVLAFKKSVIVTHTGEDIFKSPVTTVLFSSAIDHSKEVSDRYWKVGLDLHTYRDDLYYEWVIDTETDSVYAGNPQGKMILNLLK